MLVDEVDAGLVAVLGGQRDLQLLAEGGQQLRHREFGIDDEGDIAVRGQLFQKAAAQCGLAGADLAGQ
ncbi:hypothetical protein D3C85_1001470 [compost metagenome]